MVRLSGRRQVVVDGQRLEPDVQLILSLRERLKAPPIETLPLVEAREVYRRECAVGTGRVTPVKSVRDLTIDGADGPLRARHYAPYDEPGGPRPLLVFLHGGGFVIGDLDTHDAPCRILCRHAGVHVLAVDYRLSPEHEFPAGVDDALAALRWAVEHAGALGADPERVAIGGDSAGGNLSAVASQLAARDGGPAPALQLLLYPATDATKRRPSYDLFGEGFALTSGMIDWFVGHYILEGADPADPRRSPLMAEDKSGLAPAIVVTAGYDPLRDEGEEYAAALSDAGVPVVARRFPGLFHGFIHSAGVSPSSRAALIEVAGMTRAALAAPPARG
jgi:acetyl esterase